MPPDMSYDVSHNLISLISIFFFFKFVLPVDCGNDELRITDSEVIELRECFSRLTITVYLSCFLFSHFVFNLFTQSHIFSLYNLSLPVCILPAFFLGIFKATAPENKQHPAVYAREYTHRIQNIVTYITGENEKINRPMMIDSQTGEWDRCHRHRDENDNDFDPASSFHLV